MRSCVSVDDRSDIPSSPCGPLFVRLSGTPYAMGRQHGQALGSAIRRVERVFLQFPTPLYGGGARGGVRASATYVMLRLIASAMALRNWPMAYREELQGLVAGEQVREAGRLDTTRLAALNAFDDIVGSWAVRSLVCSAVAVHSNHDGMIVERNLDYQVIPNRLAALSTLFVSRPQGRLPFVSLGWRAIEDIDG